MSDDTRHADVAKALRDLARYPGIGLVVLRIELLAYRAGHFR